MKMQELITKTEQVVLHGTAEQRDALRFVANGALSSKFMFKYELPRAPNAAQAYRALSDFEFSGPHMPMLLPDEMYSLDSLLSKKQSKDFMQKICRVALTLYKTNPLTAFEKWWPTKDSACCDLLMQAFQWLVIQDGLDDILADQDVVDHTRLPQFLLTMVRPEQEEVNVSAWSLFAPTKDTGYVGASLTLDEEGRKARDARRQQSLPITFDELHSKNAEELISYLVETNLLDKDDADDYRHDRTKPEKHLENLRDIFYEQYGVFPSDHPYVDDEDLDEGWVEGESILTIAYPIPPVRLLTTPVTPAHGSKKSRAREKPDYPYVTIPREHQVWHKVYVTEDDIETFGDRRFSIILVSRPTCGSAHNTVSHEEALTIAAALSSALKSK